MSVNKPEDIPVLFQKFWNQREARSLANLFVEEADFVNVVGIWWQNQDDIYKAHEYGLRVIFNESELKVMKVKVRKLGEEVAVVHSRMRLKGQSKPQNSNSISDLRYTMFSFVCQRLNGEWKAVSAHNTDIVPGAETNMNIEGELKATNYRNKKRTAN